MDRTLPQKPSLQMWPWDDAPAGWKSLFGDVEADESNWLIHVREDDPTEPVPSWKIPKMMNISPATAAIRIYHDTELLVAIP